jgi:predicted Zn finger-like uncharacterized protein
MANVISCPKCERQLRVPDDLLGQSVKCPSCSETFTATLPKNEPPPSRAPARDEDDRPSRRPPPRRRDDDDDDDNDDRRSRRRRMAPHRGDTIQLLGILSFFLIPYVLAPMAWIMGSSDLAEMNAGRMDTAGRKATETGVMCAKISLFVHLGLMGLSFLVFFGMCCCIPMMSAAGGGGGSRY